MYAVPLLYLYAIILSSQRNGLNDTGALIKPTSGSNGNLAFDVAVDQLQYSYEQQNHKKTTSYWPQLFAFTQGIAGNGASPRSKFVFDAVELSEVTLPSNGETLRERMLPNPYAKLKIGSVAESSQAAALQRESVITALAANHVGLMASMYLFNQSQLELQENRLHLCSQPAYCLTVAIRSLTGM